MHYIKFRSEVSLFHGEIYHYLFNLLVETKYQLHAKEVAQALDLTKYDGIVCVSGDGILVEVSLLCLLLFIVQAIEVNRCFQL